MPELFGLLVGAAFAGAIAAMFHHYVVRISKARSWLARGAVLVDVDGDLAERRPDAAVHVAIEDLGRRAHELGEHDTPIVVFSRSWRRGVRATYELRGIGFWEVMNAAGLRTRQTLSEVAVRAAEARKLGTLRANEH